jgi:YidC/Oxa1 family membrane protein insertase
MDKRTLLAVALMALVIVLTPMIFRAPARQAPPPTTGSGATTSTAKTTTPVAEAPEVPTQRSAAASAPAPRLAPETTSVASARKRFTFSTRGAAPLEVGLPGYRVLRPGSTGEATLVNPRENNEVPPLLRYRLAVGADTINLDTVAFHAARSQDGVTFTSEGTPRVEISYRLSPDGYLTNVQGAVTPSAPDTRLLIDLPRGLRSQEADSADDIRHLAHGFKRPQSADVTSVSFGKLDAAGRTEPGPIQWVSTRNKYFLVALLTPPNASFDALYMRGGPRVEKLAPTARATVSKPLQDGRFTFDLYAGPQSWQQLRAVGNGLENVNPYGGWIPGVQPFAMICMRILLWLKKTLNVSYGWVLVIFGVAVRFLLWPLNQSAMRSSLKMQRLQPELMEVQKRYKEDPEKQREAMIKLYQEHGMSPLSPLMGCLPMLLPMPVLFALFFVFQNTIEFRGVPFLWLPDLSLKDPYYITPIFMGISMFVLSWIGMRAAPPNPQTKMMSYMMPAVMTMVLLNFASGLNLYYAVQNIAALPQQWLLTRERMRSGTGTPKPTVQPRQQLRGRRAAT